MRLRGYISVGLPLGPGAHDDPYFVTNPRYGLGAIRSVGTTADRDAIVQARREEGMVVYVGGETAYYSLIGGTANSNWQNMRTVLGANTFTYGVDPPATASPGDRWYQPEDAVVYTFIDDGDTRQWVDVSSGLAGATGATGPTGDPGPAGPTGFAPLATTGSTGVASFFDDHFEITGDSELGQAEIRIKTGIVAGRFIILGSGGTAGTGKLPAVDGSELLDVNAWYLRGKAPEQVTDGGTF